MEEDTNKWKVISFSWIGRINTIKTKILSIHPKWSADSRQSLSKFHWLFSQKQKRQHYHKSHMELQAICSLACFLKPKQSWERTKLKASPNLIANYTKSYSQNSMVQEEDAVAAAADLCATRSCSWLTAVRSRRGTSRSGSHAAARKKKQYGTGTWVRTHRTVEENGKPRYTPMHNFDRVTKNTL